MAIFERLVIKLMTPEILNVAKTESLINDKLVKLNAVCKQKGLSYPKFVVNPQGHCKSINFSAREELRY